MSDQRTIISNTPVETYWLDGQWVCVKREDLCSPYPGPGFAKIRGIAEYLRGLRTLAPAVGVLSTLVSRAGWGTAYICQELGMVCHNFHPKTDRTDLPVGRYCEEVKKLGGRNIPLVNSRGSVLWARAARAMAAEGTGAIMLPHHLALKETIEQTALEAARTMQQVGKVGTVVIPVGSGTIAAGVLRGIATAKGIAPVDCVLGITASKSVSTARRRSSIIKKSGITIGGFFGAINNFHIEETTRDYLEVAPALAPFPCDLFYDAKAWEWLTLHIKELRTPILFWNIGGNDHA
jgi:threonine dehydratase